MTSLAALAGLIAGITITAAVLWAWRRRALTTPRARRIAFPFVGATLADPALDAALRLARAEHATLVAVYLVTVAKDLPLDAPLPTHAKTALPLLDAIEQRARRAGVPIDARIQTGRSIRHAITQFLDYANYDRLVVPAGGTTFGPADIAWLLANSTTEVVVLRPRTQRREPDAVQSPTDTDAVETKPRQRPQEASPTSKIEQAGSDPAPRG
ncbi:MAG TPA: universal stress protein [Solirubrobacteraceae bacterium]|nr:universal stress protein [Solirubrobacteraceae bacterium]